MEQNNMSSLEKYEDRFGYKESGTFYCGYAGEYILFALCICVLIIGIILLDIAILEPAQKQTSLALILALASLIVCTIWGIGWAVAAKLVLSGFECHYECDRECFITTVGIKTRTIYYKEVLGVCYEELTLFGRTRGYIVTISTLNGTIRYRLVFPNRRAATNSKNTIFNIIDERAAHIRQMENPAPVPITERFDESYLTEERMRGTEPVLGAVMPGEQATESSEPSEMPSISLSTDSVIARLNAELSGEKEEQPPLSARLSPTVEQQRFPETDGEKNLIISKGTMRLEQKWNLPAAVAVIPVSILICIAISMSILKGKMGMDGLPLVVILCLMMLILTISGVVLCLDGKRVSYKANSIEFRITDRKGKSFSFYYCDVKRVDYKEFRLLWMTRGYVVTITTKYRTITYKWLFPDKMKYCAFKKTPFQVIIDHCPPFEPLKNGAKRDSKKK